MQQSGCARHMGTQIPTRGRANPPFELCTRLFLGCTQGCYISCGVSLACWHLLGFAETVHAHNHALRCSPTPGAHIHTVRTARAFKMSFPACLAASS